MSKTIINIKQFSDDAIIKKIGQFVKHHRLAQNITQKELAEKAGINRTTLSDLELGRRCQLLTLIQVLRILKQLSVFNSFEISETISPILLAELEKKKRQRASNKNEGTDSKPSDW